MNIKLANFKEAITVGGGSKLASVKSVHVGDAKFPGVKMTYLEGDLLIEEGPRLVLVPSSNISCLVVDKAPVKK